MSNLFWKTLPKRYVRHLWRTNLDNSFSRSACGLEYFPSNLTQNSNRKCKNCKRAVHFDYLIKPVRKLNK